MNKLIERVEVNKGWIEGEKKYPKRDKTQYCNRMRFDVVVVLGMHRSGTSALAKALELFGVDLGQNLMAASEHNPKGYFEDNELVEINNRIYAKASSNWSSIQFLEPANLLGPRFEKEQKEAREFLERKLAQGNPIGLKDPRLCRTLPLWEKIFVEMGIRVRYLMPFRNPFEIAASLQKRDGMTTDYGLTLWGSYQTDALRHTEGKSRLFVGFHQLLENSGCELARIAEFLETAWNPHAESTLEYQKKFLDSYLRHHQTKMGHSLQPPASQRLAVALDAVCQQSNKKELENVENAGKEALLWMMQVSDLIKQNNQILLPSSNSVELFYSKDQGDFSEKRKFINSFDKMSDSKEVINVSLSDEVGLAPYWRVDPGFRPGKIHFLGMKFLGPKGRVVWDLQDHREQILVQGTAVQLSLPPVGVELVSTGSDPAIILPALPADALPIASIHIDIEINKTQEEIAKLIQLQAQKVAHLLQAVVEKDLQVEQIKSSLDAKEMEIAQAVKTDQKIEQIRQEIAADREETKLEVKKVEEELATREKQNVSLQKTLSQIRQEIAADRKEYKLVVKKVEEERAQERKAQQEAVENSVGEAKKVIAAEIQSLIKHLVEQGEKNRHEVSARIDSVKEGMEGHIIEVGEYAAKIRKAFVSPSSYMIPAPFSWYSYLYKMLNIREPVWLNKEKRSREVPKRPGFWRRLERSIRKRRKNYINRLDFDEYPDVAAAKCDPWSHYRDSGMHEGRYKSKKDKERKTKKESVGCGETTYLNLEHKSSVSNYASTPTEIELKEFGYTFLGPALALLFQEINKNLSETTVPIFLAREGFALKNIYSELMKENLLLYKPFPVYLKVSRQVLYKRILLRPDLNKIIWESYEGKTNLKEFLMHKCQIDETFLNQKIPREALEASYDLPKEIDKLNKAISKNSEELNIAIKEDNENIDLYLKTFELNKERRSPLFIDIGYSGTAQKILSSILNIPSKGVYLITTGKEKEKINNNELEMIGSLRNNVQFSSGYVPLVRSLLLEALLTADTGQVVKILKTPNECFDFIYGITTTNQSLFHLCKTVQLGAQQCVIDCFKNRLNWKKHQVEKILETNLSKKLIPKSLCQLFEIDDMFHSSSVLNSFEIFT